MPEANAALIENARHYLENPDDLADRDNFHWHSEMLLRLIEMYGAKGREAAGRLGPEAETEILAAVWQYVRRVSKLADADADRSQTWEVHESENHHLQIITTLWHFAQIARERPEYREIKFEDGFRAEEHSSAWTTYLKAYCLERARKGLFIEAGSDNYNGVAIKGLYNMFDFAADPELARRAGLLLDLFWACWAEQQLDGVRGGGKARIYQGGDSLSGRGSHIARLAWFYFGLGQPPKSVFCPMLSALTSRWKPAQVVADLAQDSDSRGSYSVRQRVQGLAVPGFHTLPVYHLRTDLGGILNYAWCTPGFVLGSLMFEARPGSDWAAISSQNRWQGVVFSGDPEARIVPQVRKRGCGLQRALVGSRTGHVDHPETEDAPVWEIHARVVFRVRLVCAPRRIRLGFCDSAIRVCRCASCVGWHGVGAGTSGAPSWRLDGLRRRVDPGDS